MIIRNYESRRLRFSLTSKNDLKERWEVTSENDLMDLGEKAFVINLDVLDFI
jgi:hypothetical protein